MTRGIFTLCCIVLCICNSVSQNIFNVPGDYDKIQDALNAAEDNTIINVSEGVYYENLIWPLDVNNLELKGAGAEFSIIDGQQMSHVILMEYVLDASIEGFTLMNGSITNLDNGTYEGGAGLYVEGSSPRLKDLVIRENIGKGTKIAGAGMLLKDFSGEIQNCEFLENTIEAELALGAGLYVDGFSGMISSCRIENNEVVTKEISKGIGLYISCNDEVQISDCIINNNVMQGDSISTNRCYGGGLFLDIVESEYDIIDVQISNCQFTNNYIGKIGNGAGMQINNSNLQVRIDSCLFQNNIIEGLEENFNGMGGGILSYTNKLNINHSIFKENKVQFGAGLYLYSLSELEADDYEVIINSCVFDSNISNEGSVFCGKTNFNTKTLFKNCIAKNNIGSTIKAEGLIAQGFDFFYELIELEHCTFAHNFGAIDFNIVDFKAKNSIFWNNGEQEFEAPNCVFEITHSILKGGGTGTNTIVDDPLFIDQESLVPAEGSPCISNGTSDISLSKDIDGNPRPQPINTAPDIGAFEVDYGISKISDQPKFEIGIFPNPASETLYFEEEVEMCVVYNDSGEKLMEVKNVSNIDITVLTKGSYTVELIRDQRTLIHKFVKF